MKAGVLAIDWWNEASLEECQALCARLGWPADYAEGEASLEWLTADQLAALQALPYKALYEAEREVEQGSDG